MKANPGDQATWDTLLATYKEHFNNEEDSFTQITDDDYDIADHKRAHEGLVKTVEGATVPISTEMIDFIMNWLAQHIKWTDFKYKGRIQLLHPVPDPYVWDASFMVGVSQQIRR